MADTNSLRGALLEQLLGDVDALIKRVELIPGIFETANKDLAFTVGALDDSGDRYRLAVTASTEDAKAELLEYIKRKAAETATASNAEQRLAIADAAKHSLRKEATEAVIQALRTSLATTLDEAVGKIALKLHQPLSARLLEHTITAVMASVLTVALLHLVHFI